MTTILKLGGSVITDKTAQEAIDEAALERIASALSENRPNDLVLVHGGGSFGHPAAAEHAVGRSTGTRDPGAIQAIDAAMTRLNRAVVSALLDEDVPAVGLEPRAAAAKDATGRATFEAFGTRALLDEQFVPVTYGYVVAHAGRGSTVLSGDAIATSLGRSLEAERIGLCTDVPGVLDDSGTVIPEISSFDAVAPYLSDGPGVDVTGGIARKVQALLETPVTGAIFDLESLPTFLAGEVPGTRVLSADDADTF